MLFRSADLLARNFHQQCNLYLPNSAYQFLNRPRGVQLYEGNLQHDLDHPDDIVALNLAATVNDIVMLLGFDLRDPKLPEDRLLRHRMNNRFYLIKAAVENNPNVQWLAIDTPQLVSDTFTNLPNFDQDLLSTILS